jgi:hypothetical protein
MTTTSDLMQDVYANFIGAYAGQTAQGNIIVAFEPLGIMPGLDPSAPGVAAAALEFLSVNADWLPDLSSGSYDPTGRTISGTYNLIVNASSPAVGVDATTFNLLKSSANEMMENGKAGSQLGAYTYFPTFASPANWFDTTVQTNWTSYSYVAGKPAPTPTPTLTPIAHPPYRMLLAPTWRLTANAVPVTLAPPPPPSPPAPAPNAVHAMIMRSPSFMVRERIYPAVLQIHPAQAAASLVINNAGPTPALQPEFTITFDYCLMQLRRPWMSGDFLASGNWYIAGAHSGDYACGPIVATSAGSTPAPTATPASGTATSTPAATISTPAPPAPTPPAAPFSWAPVACIAIKNLVIDAGGGALDPSVMTSATAFGPFAFRPQPGTSDKLSNPGVQIVAWVCQAQPLLPPQSDPALLPPPPPSASQTAETIISTAAGVLGGLLGKGG